MKGTLAEWSKASDLSPDSARSVGSNPTGTNRFFVFVYLNEKHTRKKPKKIIAIKIKNVKTSAFITYKLSIRLYISIAIYLRSFIMFK